MLLPRARSGLTLARSGLVRVRVRVRVRARARVRVGVKVRVRVRVRVRIGFGQVRRVAGECYRVRMVGGQSVTCHTPPGTKSASTSAW